MRKGIICNSLVFVFSLLSLIIVMRTFWYVGIFVDANNTSPANVYGGAFWSTAQWVLMPMLFIIVLLSAYQIIISSLK